MEEVWHSRVQKKFYCPVSGKYNSGANEGGMNAPPFPEREVLIGIKRARTFECSSEQPVLELMWFLT